MPAGEPGCPLQALSTTILQRWGRGKVDMGARLQGEHVSQSWGNEKTRVFMCELNGFRFSGSLFDYILPKDPVRETLRLTDFTSSN